MRNAALLLMIGCWTAALSAAEPTRSRLPLLDLLAQLAPDGFPLKFPQSQLPAPAAAPIASPAAEELPAPKGPAFTTPGTAMPVPSTPLPAPTLVPAPTRAPSVPVRYLTHRELAATFQPAPANYEVMMVHPYTHCPVKVCFSLPPGCIRKVAADRNELRFDYGKWELEVHFKRDGRVALDIDD
jgi:hypothetical protein